MEAVKGRVEVYLDGGVRQGTDVLKALALGAKAVFIGRPVLWGLSYQVCHLLLYWTACMYACVYIHTFGLTKIIDIHSFISLETNNHGE